MILFVNASVLYIMVFFDVGISQTFKDDSDHIVLESGATSHMRRNISDFEDDYVTYNDIFGQQF